jgi:predicted metalloprotease
VKKLALLLLLVVGLAVPATASANITDPNEVASVVGDSLTQFWSTELGQIGRSYSGPRQLVWTGDRERTPCGPSQAMNAAYCGADHTIYLGTALFDNLLRSNADYAAGAVLAHEWGHDIQDELGILPWAIRHHFYKGVELQADCYAGVYSRYADDQGLLEPGDLDEAVALMTAVGDRTSLSPSTPGAHGTPAQRVAWFERGYKTNSLAECMKVYGALYGKKQA